MTAPDPATSAIRDSVNSATVNGLPAPTLAQAEQNVLTNIDPTSPPAMKTLVYSPDVRIYIARGNKQYDVSADIVAWSIRRVENSVSSAVFRLSNKATESGGKKMRYNQLFERMDRVVIWLKRVEWVQVFSGYLDQVPHVQLYPGTVNFRASCTLKRLLHTYWDPGLPASQTIFDQAGEAQREMANGEASLDLGLGSLLRRLLTLVGGWDPKNIHVQRFPLGFFQFMEKQIRLMTPGDEAAVESFKGLLLGEGDTSLGPGRSASMQQGVTMGGYSIGSQDRMLEVIRAVDEMGMGVDTTSLAAAQGIGTAATGGSDNRDRPAWQAQQEVGKNWAEAALKNDAAVHCFMTIAAESNWIMYANRAVPESLSYPYEGISTDHSSVGLYQQQNFGEWGSLAQRMNVKASTQMFLQQLNRLEWRNMDRAAACQAVQRSKFSDGSNYKVHEAAAIEQVRSIRSGSGTALGAAGQNNVSPTNPIPGTGETVIGGAPSPTLPGTVGTPVPSVPTSNGMPTATAVTSAATRGPLYDTGGALTCAIAQCGKPYVYGANGPDTFDCSSLTQFAYRSIGLEIGRTTYEQAGNLQRIPASNLVPGDIIQPDAGHTGMYVGPGQWVHAPQTGDVVRIGNIYFPLETAVCFRVPGAEFGGTLPAPYDLQKALSASNARAGTVTGGLGGSTGTGQTEPIARNLFTYQFMQGQFTSDISAFFGAEKGGEEKAFINDQPLIQTVVSFSQAGLRNFQSAPNGDFIAYYPDYFGLDGKDAVFALEDIEMKNVQIDLNDDAMSTHVYIAGSQTMNASDSGILGWLNTKGVASVENEWLFRRMIAAAPHVPGEMFQTGQQIMEKFGARPLSQTMTSVMAGPMEFLLAVQIFMKKWAEQYSTVIETTFMPEIFPGMRVHLVGHNLQVYVSEVTHAGDFENGFTTSMTIMAPSNPNILKMATSIFDAKAEEISSRQDLFRNAAEST
jgi:cell wall-associated NlpC family hydrolase